MLRSLVVLLVIIQSIFANDSCRYEHPTKGIINLSSVGLRSGHARFPDVLPSISSLHKYSFNPCYSFSESGCQNVAVCQISTDGIYSFSLAKQNLSTWSATNDGNAVLTYKYGAKTVSITMICSENNQDELEVLGENPVNYYQFRLKSSCACWNGCEQPKPTATTRRPSTSSTTPGLNWDACRYHDSRYGTIDLSSVGSANGDPAFKDVSTNYISDYLWSYNPCYSFSEKNCQHVAGCQINKVRETSTAIASQSYVIWTNMDRTSAQSNPMITYSSSLSNGSLLRVLLACNATSSDHRLEVVGQTAPKEYMMILNSPCACWNGCVAPTPTPPVPFHWTIMMTMGVVVLLFACLLITMITCLMCSKPKRNHYNVVAINEKTPIVRHHDYGRKQ